MQIPLGWHQLKVTFSSSAMLSYLYPDYSGANFLTTKTKIIWAFPLKNNKRRKKYPNKIVVCWHKRFSDKVAVKSDLVFVIVTNNEVLSEKIRRIISNHDTPVHLIPSHTLRQKLPNTRRTAQYMLCSAARNWNDETLTTPFTQHNCGISTMNR